MTPFDDSTSEDLGQTVRLFSYGTLQQPEVQRGTFGREVRGKPDHLLGWTTSSVRITDPEVIALSGSVEHPMLVFTGNPADQVMGTVFEITAEELEAADEYEVEDYRRVEVVLGSGKRCWVYLDDRCQYQEQPEPGPDQRVEPVRGDRRRRNTTIAPSPSTAHPTAQVAKPRDRDPS